MKPDAGFIVLRGNLFDNAIMKTSVIDAEFRKRYLSNPKDPEAFEGRAIVFDGPEDYHHRIDDPEAEDRRALHAVHPRHRADRLSRRRGGREHAAAAALIKKGVNALPCIGDGRQSGTSGSPSILNASPEAAARSHNPCQGGTCLSMLPGFRFLFAAIVLSMSILVFGLGAAALLRAAHEQFASNPSWRAAPEAMFANDPKPRDRCWHCCRSGRRPRGKSAPTMSPPSQQRSSRTPACQPLSSRQRRPRRPSRPAAGGRNIRKPWPGKSGHPARRERGAIRCNRLRRDRLARSAGQRQVSLDRTGLDSGAIALDRCGRRCVRTGRGRAGKHNSFSFARA